ncbi:flavin-binding monooxygenase [Pilimelia anulata]|uniref:Flavin-binding monooxygenase n=1 Tax=Pilimelia anulata TaxID=53371 RepID=A0A8J3B3K7_9ACTN|nr:NAD(P)-binding domain-containing protein [Pilimelia anulata]GGJ85123.1 flavin-binding monooxygenase [Pilimelia anulata]
MNNESAVADRGGAVCVVGAGAAGLAAVKNLREHGFDVDCYERETGVGGLWNWRHERSPVTAATHLISSRPMTEFPDFPMPDHWPDYPHHRQAREYLERYATHFELSRDIWFGTEVTWVNPTPDLRWDVTTASTGGDAPGRVTRYDALVVANGHHWHPVRPHYPGQDGYPGRVLHAGECKEPDRLRGLRVLVVGGGNSAADLAVALAGQAAACWYSTRRGYWLYPKYLHGRPVDQAGARLRAAPLPRRWRQRIAARILHRAVGPPERYGLPRPDHPPLAAHPTVNSQLPHHIGHGLITPVPDIERFDGKVVHLTDGRTIDPEVVVLATGYRPRYDFLPGSLLGDDERPRLGLHVFAPEQPTLAVVGLPQTAGGMWPGMHWQSVAVARWLRLWHADPVRAAAVRPTLFAAGDFAAPTVDTPRHHAEVDPHRYLLALQALLDRMAAPAAAR